MLRIARKPTRDVLITGRSGFVGTHLTAQLLANTDARITFFGDLSEPGVEQNLKWLDGQAERGRLNLLFGQAGNSARLAAAVARASEIYHLIYDDHLTQDSHLSAEDERRETATVIEAACRSSRNPVVVCASIGNALAAGSDVEKNEAGSARGSRVCERIVRDAARRRDLAAVMLRIDTVTGPRQFGDGQDWVAELEYAALADRPCSVPGDPWQLRNVLDVTDAVNAMIAARAYIGNTCGKAYSLTGGCAHSVTAVQMLHLIEQICHRRAVMADGEEAGRCTRAAQADPSFLLDTSWTARKSLEETVREISAFWHANRLAIASYRERPQRVSHSQAA